MNDRRKLLREIAERGGVNISGGSHLPVETQAIKGRRRILHDEVDKAEIAGHPGRRRHAVVRRQPYKDQAIDALRSQVLLEGSSDEAAVDLLEVDRLAGKGQRFRLGLVPRRAAKEMSRGGAGRVMNMADRPMTTAPDGEEPGDVGFRLRVVARAPSRIEETLLNVDDKQSGVRRQHGVSRARTCKGSVTQDTAGAKDDDPSKSAIAHLVAFLLYPDHQLLDLAGPLDTFHAANDAAGRLLYRTRVLSRCGGQVAGCTGVTIATEPVDERSCDTVMVVGGKTVRLRHSPDVMAVKRLAVSASRIASVCTGAFLLAEAGLLDGRRATTHWARARDLQRDYPAVTVEADRIFVVDGPIWTSAGISAGIDLALALIEADHGPDLARTVARELVVYHRRPSGQSQFSALSQMEPTSDRMRIALTFVREHLAEALSLERLAEAARLSPRQFGRAFRSEIGETPAKAVERLRVEAARSRLEDGSEPIELVPRAVGFNDPERMRRAFLKRYGQPPQAMRRVARRSQIDPGLQKRP